MRSLVAFHSLSGTTRHVAELAARELQADLVEARTSRYGRGISGYLRAAYDSVFGKLPVIEPSAINLKDYDFTLLMAPVWAGHASTPMRAFLTLHRGTIKRSAIVLTCGGRVPASAYEELAELIGVRPIATFSLREKDIRNASELPAHLVSFLKEIRTKAAA